MLLFASEELSSFTRQVHSDANKALLFSVMLTLRRKLEVYGERVRFEQERAGPLLSVLQMSKTHGLLSMAADEMSEVERDHRLRGGAEINEVRRHAAGESFKGLRPSQRS